MTSVELQAYLYDQIPLTAAMSISVVEASATKVVIRAPLAPNRNHRQTAFGGSIGAVATVAAWSWLRLKTLGLPVRLVIRSSQVEFLLPIEGEFTAICSEPESATRERFFDAVTRRGTGRIELKVAVESGGQNAATFVGTFVALKSDQP